MSMKVYEDFMDLGLNNLTDYLSIRGMEVTGKKVILVARAFYAYENKLPIIGTLEDQKKALAAEYDKRLKEFKICDPLSIETEKHSDDFLKWPKLDLGNIFNYILKVRDFDIDYVGRYKDQKAFSYFDSGFVHPIYVYVRAFIVKKQSFHVF